MLAYSAAEATVLGAPMALAMAAVLLRRPARPKLPWVDIALALQAKIMSVEMNSATEIPRLHRTIRTARLRRVLMERTALAGPCPQVRRIRQEWAASQVAIHPSSRGPLGQRLRLPPMARASWVALAAPGFLLRRATIITATIQIWQKRGARDGPYLA